VADLQSTAEMLWRLRHSAIEGRGRGQFPAAALEALLWIAAGVDNQQQLAVAMGKPGKPLATATTNRIVSMLRGRDRWAGTRWVKAPFAPLVEARRHPDRPGLKLSLTQEGAELIGRLSVVKTTDPSENPDDSFDFDRGACGGCSSASGCKAGS
jgi:hypothetical protein